MKRSDLRLAKLALIVGSLAIAISPWLWSLPTMLGINFESSGQIGDTIGGTTAPIVGLVGALLLFLALKAQITANEIVMSQMQEQRELDTYQKLSTYMTQQVQLLRDDMNDFSLTQTTTDGPSNARVKNTVQYKGVEAIIEALDTMKELRAEHDEALIDIPQFAHIRMILDRLCILVEDIAKRSLTPIDKEYLMSTARFTYEARLKPVLTLLEEHRVSKQEPCKSCGKVHTGIPEEIYSAYDRLNVLLP